jgi:hypothetical protein
VIKQLPSLAAQVLGARLDDMADILCDTADAAAAAASVAAGGAGAAGGGPPRLAPAERLLAAGAWAVHLLRGPLVRQLAEGPRLMHLYCGVELPVQVRPG